MKHPIPFTFIGLQLATILDTGANESVDIIEEKLRNNLLFLYLTKKYDIDMTLFKEIELNEIENLFYDIAVISRKKMGIQKNGLCLLIMCCFEAAQREVKNLYPEMKVLYGKI